MDSDEDMFASSNSEPIQPISLSPASSHDEYVPESRVFPRGVRAESPVISLTWITVAAATGKISVIVLGNIQTRPGSILESAY